MKYLYEGHLGSMFTCEEHIPLEKCYCETCGDYDTFIGTFETLEDLWKLIKPECSIDGSGGWSLQYIFPMIVSEFKLPVKLTYDSYDEESQGMCNLSDNEILQYIEEFIHANIESN